MIKTSSDLPGVQLLTEGISSVLGLNGFPRGLVTIMNRESNIYRSTSPCEIVTCRLADGQILRLLCKYSPGQSYKSYGHRGGIDYEGEVYRRILTPSRLPVPAFYGTYTGAADGRSWLLIEYLDDCSRITISPEPDALFLAVRWIAGFHSANESPGMSDRTSFLNVYNTDYYLGWLQRAFMHTRHLQKRFPWLTTLNSRFRECLLSLAGLQQTVIHGEYYPSNVLIRDRTVYPVDWESAAVGPGVIDLASLTEGWPEDIAQEYVREYSSARWPGETVHGLDQKVDAARVYLCLRWLGDGPERTNGESAIWYLEQLLSAGRRLGLFSEEGI